MEIVFPPGVFITMTAAASGSFEIDIIHADAGAANDPQTIRRFQNLRGHLGLAADNDAR